MSWTALIFTDLLPYSLRLTDGSVRFGAFLEIFDDQGHRKRGDVAPLPGFSLESLQECIEQWGEKKQEVEKIRWTLDNWVEELEKLNLLPALSFGLESALLALLDPLPQRSVEVSALLMGTARQILETAALREVEGYVSAKVKVGHLPLEEAREVLYALKERFRLRVDVNRAWKTEDALRFFAEFPLDAFDYVEEPFQNPRDLGVFSHPLAIDESFPEVLSLADLESFPTLKALVYKPTIQGGLLKCLPLQKWTQKRKVALVLSSSFESDVGLVHIALMARRLALKTPVGIGTCHYLYESSLRNQLGNQAFVSSGFGAFSARS